MHSRAGDTDRAAALLEQARAASAPGNERATVLAHLAGIHASPQDAVALYREALSDAEGDDALQATIHLSLAGPMRFSDGIERGVEHGQLAVLAASRVDDAALRCRALAAYGLVHFHAGRGIPAAQMEEALSLERSLAEWPLDFGPTIVFGHQLWWSADVDRARALFQDVRNAVSARNDPAGAAEALWFLSFLEWRAGRRSHELRNTFVHEPGLRLELGDLLEALIATGELDEADTVLASWQERADALDRAWALAILARSRGLLLAARGDF